MAVEGLNSKRNIWSMSTINWVVVLICVGGMALHGFLLRMLRLEHPTIWESLGRPSLIANNSPQNSLATLRFLFKGDYEDLDDAKLVRYCRFLRLFDFVGGGIVCLWLIFHSATGS